LCKTCEQSVHKKRIEQKMCLCNEFHLFLIDLRESVCCFFVQLSNNKFPHLFMKNIFHKNRNYFLIFLFIFLNYFNIKFEVLIKESNIHIMIKDFFSTAIIAGLPILELRFAIPWGFFQYNLPLWFSTIASLSGNIIAVGIVLWLWPHIANFARKHSPFCDKILQKIFHKTRNKHSRNFETWGNLFLIFFVMLPIPGSGGWSGALVAWLFGIKYTKAITLISIGLILGGIIVAGMTIGADESIAFFT
jgi:uncharacterized membrane protein